MMMSFFDGQKSSEFRKCFHVTAMLLLKIGGMIVRFKRKNPGQAAVVTGKHHRVRIANGLFHVHVLSARRYVRLHDIHRFRGIQRRIGQVVRSRLDGYILFLRLVRKRAAHAACFHRQSIVSDTDSHVLVDFPFAKRALRVAAFAGQDDSDGKNENREKYVTGPA